MNKYYIECIWPQRGWPLRIVVEGRDIVEVMRILQGMNEVTLATNLGEIKVESIMLTPVKGRQYTALAEALALAQKT